MSKLVEGKLQSRTRHPDKLQGILHQNSKTVIIYPPLCHSKLRMSIEGEFLKNINKMNEYLGCRAPKSTIKHSKGQ